MTFSGYDLHMHSHFSDGTDSVEELFDSALQAGLKGLSITDHDTLKAYEVAQPLAKEKGLQLLPGIEMSTTFEGESIHLLGYSFSLKDKGFIQFVEHMQEVRKNRNVAIIKKLAEHGMPLDITQLKEDIGVIGRPHMANALLKLGHVQSVREAFERFLGEGMPCFVGGDRPEMTEVIDEIHKAKGFAVIAHPHFIRKDSLIRKLLKLPLDGIEVYYGSLSYYQEQVWERRAEQKNLFKTGGSDYHGKNRPHITLGISWTPEPVFHHFWKRYLENEKLHANH